MAQSRNTYSLFTLALGGILAVGCNGEGVPVGNPDNLCEMANEAGQVEGWVDVSNVTGWGASLQIVEPFSGEVVGTASFRSVGSRGNAPDSMMRLRVPEGLYTAQALTGGTVATPELVTVACDRPFALTLRRADRQPDPMPGMDEEPQDPQDPRLELPREIRDQILRYSNIPGLPRPILSEEIACARVRSDEEFIRHLLKRSDWMLSPVMARVLANKDYIEDFLATYFPGLYAEAGGEAIELVPLFLDQRIPTGGIVDAFEFRVKPQFQFLNDRMAHGGVVKRYQAGSGTSTPVDVIKIFPRAGYDSSSVMIEQRQLADSREFGVEQFDYMVWRNDPAPMEAYEIGFTKREPCFPDHLYSSIRAGFRVRGDIWFGSWRPADEIRAHCATRRLRLAVHGRTDFLRRKLLDLNPGRPAVRADGTPEPFPLSGQDDLLWEEPGDGSYIINYTGQYDCPREFILGS